VSDFERILVVRLSALGDVLLATPAVRALKKRFPAAQIDWLIETPYLPLIAANPHVSALEYQKRGAHAGVQGLLALRRQLKGRGYDLVIDLQDKPKTRLFRSIGAASAFIVKRTPSQALLALLGYDPPRVKRHAVDHFLEALRPLGVEPNGRHLELRLTAEMEREADAVAPPNGAMAGIAPGARWATKRWPPERFAEIARALVQRGLEPMLLGGPKDAKAISMVRANMADLRCADTMALSVGGLAAAIARCRIVVAGDSGPVHIASALGIPVVALFGPTSPNRWRPLSPWSEVVRQEMDCSPCSNHGTAQCEHGHHDCMQKLGVGQILGAADRVLARDAPGTKALTS
jgi:heptosyltransferase-2